MWIAVPESRDREGVDEMPNIGLEGGVDSELCVNQLNHHLLLQLLLMQVLDGMHVTVRMVSLQPIYACVSFPLFGSTFPFLYLDRALFCI